MEEKKYLQLSDISAQTVGGQTVNIAQEFISSTALMQALPWRSASDYKEDVVVFENKPSKWDPSVLTNLDKGVTPSKYGYYKRVTRMGMFEKAVQFNKKTMDTVENPDLYMNRQIKAMNTQLGSYIEFALLNISEKDNPDAPDGLLPKYNALTDLDGNILTKSGTIASTNAVPTPYVCLDALGGKNDGRSGALSSILVAYLDATDGLSLIYPRGSKTIGIEYHAPGPYEYRAQPDGSQLMSTFASVEARLGISLNNSLACTRIANVDPESETSLKTAMNHLFDAYERMSPSMKSRVHIFTTPQVISAMRKLQYKNIYQTTLAGVQALNLKGQVVVDGDIFTACHNMLSTEERVRAIDETV